MVWVKQLSDAVLDVSLRLERWQDSSYPSVNKIRLTFPSSISSSATQTPSTHSTERTQKAATTNKLHLDSQKTADF